MKDEYGTCIDMKEANLLNVRPEDPFIARLTVRGCGEGLYIDFFTKPAGRMHIGSYNLKENTLRLYPYLTKETVTAICAFVCEITDYKSNAAVPPLLSRP